MPVDIKLLGTSNQWKLEGPRIRIGRDPGCDIPLSPDRFPMVSREHLVLVLEKGHVRFTDPGSANGTYVNGVRAAQGRLLNADRVRLGSDGPELEITIIDDQGTGHHPQAPADATVVSTPVSLNTPTMASSADAATTMMLGSDGSLQKNIAAAQAAVPPAVPPTAVAAPPVPPTAIAPPPAVPPTAIAAPPVSPTAIAPPQAMPPTVVAPPGKPAEATQVVAAAGGHGQDPTRVVPAASPNTAYVPDVRANAPGQQATVLQAQGAQAPPPPQQQRPAEDTYSNNESTMSKEQEEMIEQRVSSLQKVVYLLAVMVVVLLGLCFYLQLQIQKTHDAVTQLNQNAQNAFAQYTPQLEQKMNAMDARMDAMDGKMKAAEDHMVQRLNAELPVMLDKYVDRKMKQINAGQLTQ